MFPPSTVPPSVLSPYRECGAKWVKENCYFQKKSQASQKLRRTPVYRSRPRTSISQICFLPKSPAPTVTRLMDVHVYIPTLLTGGSLYENYQNQQKNKDDVLLTLSSTLDAGLAV